MVELANLAHSRMQVALTAAARDLLYDVRRESPHDGDRDVLHDESPDHPPGTRKVEGARKRGVQSANTTQVEAHCMEIWPSAYGTSGPLAC